MHLPTRIKYIVTIVSNHQTILPHPEELSIKELSLIPVIFQSCSEDILVKEIDVIDCVILVINIFEFYSGLSCLIIFPNYAYFSQTIRHIQCKILILIEVVIHTIRAVSWHLITPSINLSYHSTLIKQNIDSLISNIGQFLKSGDYYPISMSVYLGRCSIYHHKFYIHA